MKRVLFRLCYGALVVAIFVVGAWFSFRRSIVGRSVLVPDFNGQSIPEAMEAAAERGLSIEAESGRARYDDQVPRDRILLQDPAPAALAKPSQVVRVVLSLGPRELRVPDLAGLPPRAAASRLAQNALELAAVSWYRDPGARVGIVAQDPEPEMPASRNAAVDVLTNRGRPEMRFVMPDLVGRDADRMRKSLEAYGFRVGSARYEAYDGVAPNAILKQFPPAGYPISAREVVSLTVAREAGAAPRISR
ncbi:MAG: PASTA domain-containing protein [Thermoanaerobaculia bacterium]